MEKPRGTKDYFGQASALRASITNVLMQVANVYNYEFIETPFFEHTEVFVRSIGETSDVVAKEMYTFEDRGGRSLTLRPEGTAGVIRAFVENKLYAELPRRLFYFGPMFRYENPQRGRLRQFTQFGVEVLSAERSAMIDAEVIIMASEILNFLNVPFQLHLNSLGSSASRVTYRAALTRHLSAHKDALSELSQRRLEANPLRILDDKIDGQKDFVKNAPKISAFLTKEDETYFLAVQSYLRQAGVPFQIDESLVRGLDYYADTTFEFLSVSGAAGAQSTLIGGGRYNDLVADFGGPNISGVGFGLGFERLANELEAHASEAHETFKPDLYVLNIAPDHQMAVLDLVTRLRRDGFSTAWSYTPLKISKALERADKSKAEVWIIAGPKELAKQVVTVRHDDQQEEVPLKELSDYLDNLLGEDEHEPKLH